MLSCFCLEGPPPFYFLSYVLLKTNFSCFSYSGFYFAIIYSSIHLYVHTPMHESIHIPLKTLLDIIMHKLVADKEIN